MMATGMKHESQSDDCDSAMNIKITTNPTIMSEPTPQTAKSIWCYTNENGERVRVTGGQLKGLAQKGLITPDTIVELVEPEQRRPRPARKVIGLFPETAPPKAKTESDEAVSSEESSVLLPPKPAEPTAPDPFNRNVPLAPSPFKPAGTTGSDPFNRNVPMPPPSGGSFGEFFVSMTEIFVSTAKATMSFISGAFGLITALILTVSVLVVLYNLVVVTGTIPPPPAGHWLERIIFFDISHIRSRQQEEPENDPVAPPVGQQIEEPIAPEQRPPPQNTRQERPVVNPTDVVPTQQEFPTDVARRQELLASAVHIDTALDATGFSGNNAMRNLANFGNSRMQAEFRQAYNTWNNASPFDKEAARVELDRVRARIASLTRTIASSVFFGDWTYSTSDLVVGGNESSFTMTINTGFNPSRFRSLEIRDTVLRFPQGVTATVSGFSSSRISLHMRGDTNAIRNMVERSNSYRARVYFTNFRSSAVPSTPTGTSSILAEVLGITIVPR